MILHKKKLDYIILFGGILIFVASFLKLFFLSEMCEDQNHEILFIEVSHYVKHILNLFFGIFLILLFKDISKRK